MKTNNYVSFERKWKSGDIINNKVYTEESWNRCIESEYTKTLIKKGKLYLTNNNKILLEQIACGLSIPPDNTDNIYGSIISIDEDNIVVKIKDDKVLEALDLKNNKYVAQMAYIGKVKHLDASRGITIIDINKIICFFLEKVEKTENKILKRNDYISWDQYFMSVAQLSSKRSKDPNTQVGACIVDKDNKILSVGYNGFPIGCSDNEFPWGREGEKLDTKYPYVVHSELNAILNYRGESLKDTRLYVTLFPCNECTKAIIQSGIKEVIYLENKYNDSIETIASKTMLRAAGIKIRQYISEQKVIKITI